MKPDIELPDDAPFIAPPDLRAKLGRCLKDKNRILISVALDKGRQKKANGVTLDTPLGGYPRESVEDITAMCAAIMHVAWVAQEDMTDEGDPPPMEFMVYLERQRGAARQRITFKYLYDPTAAEHSLDEDVPLDERRIERVIETQERMVLSQAGVISDYQETFLKLVEQINAQGKAGVELMHEAIPLLIGGIQSQVNANHEQARMAIEAARSEASNQRTETIMKWVGGGLAAAAAQVASKKLGIKMSAADMMKLLSESGFGGDGPPNMAQHAEPPSPAPSAAPAQPSAPAHSTSEAAPANGSQGDDGEPIEHPLATIAQTFASSLTHAQRAKLHDTMTKRELQAFDGLWCAETDEAAFEAYRKLGEVAGAKIMTLRQWLTPGQTEHFVTFLRAASAYAESLAEKT